MNNIKIAIYLSNGHIPEVTLADPEKGNPGIGGTQFLLFSLPHYVSKYCSANFKFLFFAENTGTLNTNFEAHHSANMVEAVTKAIKNNCQIFIFPPNYNQQNIDFLDYIKDKNIKAIAWMHNTPVLLLNQLSKNEKIARCICVGREQYEKLRDHDIFRKTSVIFNAVDPLPININEKQVKTRSVVFLGSLDFSKGFHHLASMWKKILKKFPDAELHVIGSGKMYNKSQELGSLGIADKNYERSFRKHVTDNEGNLLKSVYFHGLLGSEKYEIMEKACAGIATNPYFSETFCLAAVEIQLCNTPVVGNAYGGLLDTVQNDHSGFLRKSHRKRRKMIELLLSDYNLAGKMGGQGREFALDNFNYQTIAPEWGQTIIDVFNDKPVQLLPPNKLTFLKMYREQIQKLRGKSRFFNKIIVPNIYIFHTMEYLRLKWDRKIHRIK